MYIYKNHNDTTTTTTNNNNNNNNNTQKTRCYFMMLQLGSSTQVIYVDHHAAYDKKPTFFT